MAAKIAAPQNQALIEVADGLWCVNYPMVLSGGVQLPTRATLVRLVDGSLLCHSPVPLSEAAADQLSALGQVSLVLAPNRFHHLFVSDFLTHTPAARLFGAPGLPAKRPDLPFCGEITADTDPLWISTLERLSIDGAPAMSESVFFHRATGTLLVSDLVFNLQSPRGLAAAIGFRLMGVHKRFAQSRAWRLFLVKERAAAAKSCERLLAWPIERVVPCHGDLYPPTSGGGGVPARTALRQALAWMLDG